MSSDELGPPGTIASVASSCEKYEYKQLKFNILWSDGSTAASWECDLMEGCPTAYNAYGVAVRLGDHGTGHQHTLDVTLVQW